MAGAGDLVEGVGEVLSEGVGRVDHEEEGD